MYYTSYLGIYYSIYNIILSAIAQLKVHSNAFAYGYNSATITKWYIPEPVAQKKVTIYNIYYHTSKVILHLTAKPDQLSQCKFQEDELVDSIINQE